MERRRPRRRGASVGRWTARLLPRMRRGAPRSLACKSQHAGDGGGAPYLSYAEHMSRFVLAAVFICAAPAYGETAYFAAIPDLPVATGLSESPNQLASFAAGENSSLVIASAHGAASPEAVRAFYMDSLSALGWAYEPAQRHDDLTFLRGRERLILHIEPHDGGTYLSMRLIVRPASMNAD